ncbi:MAG: DUF4403 family protein [Christiangramia sp.]|nr:hypothetical protein [Christiangramia sp.]|tara:strand:- start:775 stop:1383 length:609 start_codon:yes stop_codon:yes gene_type:complete
MEHPELALTLPVKIPYEVLEEHLREKLVGEMIKKEKDDGSARNYAQILDAGLHHSDKPEFDLALIVTFQTLTTLFKNKQGAAVFHLKMELQKELQQIFISEFEVEGKTNNWLGDTLLETLLNNWMHDKIKQKMNFDFMPQIEEKLMEVNEKLEDKIEAKEGIELSGRLNDLHLSQIEAGPTHLWVHVSIRGNAVIELNKLHM